MKKITAMLLVCTMLLSFPCLAQSAPLYHGAPLWVDFDDPVFSTSADVFCKHDHTEICQEHHCDKNGTPANFIYETCTHCNLVIRMDVALLTSEAADAARGAICKHESGTYTSRSTVQERCCYERTYTYYYCNDCRIQIDMVYVDNPNSYHFGPFTNTIEILDGQECRCKWCEDCGALVSRVAI